MKKLKKAFTLMETLIVLTIIGILSTSLIKAYTIISELAFTIEQEKNLQNEALLLVQTLQSIADDATIDYSKYKGTLSWNNLTGTLYLTGGHYSWASLYTTGNCIEINNTARRIQTNMKVSEQLFENSWCQLVLNLEGKEIPLLNTQAFVTTEALFKIIPYDSIKEIYSGATDNNTIYNQLYPTSFIIYLHLYSHFFEEEGQNRIDLPLELFFNMNESYNDTSI